MGLWKLIRDRLYQPVFVENWQRGLLLLNGKVSKALTPGLHRVWHRPDLRVELRLWDTRKPLLSGIEPELENAIPRNWVRSVDVASGQVALVYHHGVPTAFLTPGHHLVWLLDKPPVVQLFDTDQDALPEMTPELRKLLPADAYVAGAVPEEHVGLFYRDGVCSKLLQAGTYGFWQQKRQLRVQLQAYRQTPFFALPYEPLLGENVEALDLAPQEAALIWFDGKPAHWLAQAGRHLFWKKGRKFQVERFDLKALAPELSRAQREVIPAAEYVEVRVGPTEIALVISARETRQPQVLEAGKYTVWTRGETLQVQKFAWLADPILRPDLNDVVPADWTQEVAVRRHELAIVRCGGKPSRVLPEGRYRVWSPTSAPALRVEIEILDTHEISPDPKAPYYPLLPAQSVASATVGEGQVGLLRRAGQYERTLPPGDWTFWNLERQATVQIVDLRPQTLQVSSQEMLTKDKVGLRLNLAVVWRVVDPLLSIEAMQNPGELLYLKLQLATRRFVSSRPLDELLEDRDQLEIQLKQQLSSQSEGKGVIIEEVGLKDLILPGTMRTILNQVVEAQRKAEANNILRREETAATRSLANTARVLANNPVLLRLKELEHIKEIAQSIGHVNMIVSAKELGTIMNLQALAPMSELQASAPPPAPGAEETADPE